MDESRGSRPFRRIEPVKAREIVGALVAGEAVVAVLAAIDPRVQVLPAVLVVGVVGLIVGVVAFVFDRRHRP